MHTHFMQRVSGVAPFVIAALFVLGACGSDDDGAAEQPHSTPAVTSEDRPVTTPPATEPTQPDTMPTSTTPPIPDAQLYEVIAAVIEDSDGPRVCFEVLESLPPQCGSGLVLEDWSWEDITVEQMQNGITWVDGIYLTGTYDEAAQTLTVDSTRLPTDEDRERLLLSHAMPDFTIPCETPAGGWPAPTGGEWSLEQIVALDGYAGSWIDEAQQVLTVKFTGDLQAAESAVREHYAGPLCVVAAERSQAELSAIQDQLLGMSSVQLLGTSIYVDASGEWVEAYTIAPDPDRQAAFDAEFGAGVVRLQSRLQLVA
jgi:hypothetical protein